MAEEYLSHGHGPPLGGELEEFQRDRLICGDRGVRRTFSRTLMAFVGVHRSSVHASHGERMDGLVVPYHQKTAFRLIPPSTLSRGSKLVWAAWI